MLSHYLSTALRHFRRHKLTTTINIACLAIGIVCFMAMHGVVAFFGRSDRHLENYDRIYAITQKTAVPGSDFAVPTMPFAAWRAGPQIRADFPALETVARATLGGGPLGGETSVAAGDRKEFVQIAHFAGYRLQATGYWSEARSALLPSSLQPQASGLTRERARAVYLSPVACSLSPCRRQP